MIKIAVAGCTGRMGRHVLREAHFAAHIDVVGALTRSDNPFVGQSAEALVTEIPTGPVITDQASIAFQNAEVVIEFSQQAGVVPHLMETLNQRKAFLVCTTGLTSSDKEALYNASQYIPVMMAPNTSFGIALLRKMAVLAATLLGPSYDISLLEMHHRHKKDAPSGTSLSLAEALVKVDFLGDNEPPYASQTPRQPCTIECVSLRGGSIAGDHQVIFAGDQDVFELRHRALSPTLFAQGALKAAAWLRDQKPGLYTIDDMVENSLSSSG